MIGYIIYLIYLSYMKINIDIPDELIHSLEVISAIEKQKRKHWIESLVVKTVNEKFNKYESLKI